MMYGFVGFGIHVKSILPVLLSVGCFLCIVFSFLSLCYNLHDDVAPHSSMCVYVCQRTCESRPSMSFLEVLIIRFGMGVCMPMGTCHRMSISRVGSHMEGASILQLGDLSPIGLAEEVLNK